MNRTRTTLATTAALLALAGCSSEPTYAETADACIAAVNALPKGAQAKPRPEPCEPLKDEDYTVIVADKVARDMGWTDSSGKPDRSKISPSP